MAAISPTTLLRTLIRVQGGLAALIGVGVMAAWKLDLPGVLRLHPAFAPMAFNTALWMALAGVALMTTTSRAWQWLAKLLAVVVLVLAFATSCEYLFGLQLGLDELFQRADLVTWPSDPGRPAANTATAFVLAAVALLLHARPMSVVRAVAIGLCGSGVVALAFVSLFAQTLALHEGLPWLIGGQAMSVQTSVGLMLVGAGLAELAWFVSDQALPPRWVPFSVGVLGLLATMVLWQAAIVAERVHVSGESAQEALWVRGALERRLTERVQSLVRMAHRWENAGAPSEGAWRADAALYYAQAGDYQALEWCDADGIVRWREPELAPELARALDPLAERRTAYAQAQRTRTPVMTGVIDLGPNGRGLLAIVPIAGASRVDGAIVGIFRLDRLMAGLQPGEDDVSVEVFDGPRLAYERRVAETAASRTFTSQALPVGAGTTLSVRTTPGQPLFDRERSFVPTAVLGAGVTVSMLLSTVGVLLGSSLRRSVRLREAHRELATQAAVLADQARAVEQMRDRALDATRAKSTFLAAMSHEIRTPMNSLFGMADVLWDTELTAEQREYVRIFRDNSDRLLRLVNDILDLSKVEAGHVELQSVLLDPVQIVTATLALMQPAAHKKGLALTAEVSPDVPTALLGDAARLQQILVNLVGNAIKFTEAGGATVAVTVEAEEPVAVVLRFSVVDTGPGIPAERMEQIFEPFVQADSSITRRHGGTGLGLTISRRLAELMGGRVTAESRCGAGSTFSFTARLTRAAEGTTARPGATLPRPDATNAPSTEWVRPDEALVFARADGSPLRVLLADDSPDNVLLVRMYVRDLPILVDSAENGEVAFQRFQAGDYDLVFMDGQMPLVDGLTATRRIRAWEAEQGRARTPVVALTAHALHEEARHSLDAGCDAHLTKPIRKQVLLQAIKDFTGGRAGVRAPPQAATRHEVSVMAELRELVPEFLESRRRDVGAVSRAIEARDFDAIGRAGHNMKGLGGAYGFPRISEIGEALEAVACAGDADAARVQLDALASYLSDVNVTYS